MDFYVAATRFQKVLQIFIQKLSMGKVNCVGFHPGQMFRFSHYPTAAVEGAVKEEAADTQRRFVAVSISRDISV